MTCSAPDGVARSWVWMCYLALGKLAGPGCQAWPVAGRRVQKVIGPKNVYQATCALVGAVGDGVNVFPVRTPSMVLGP